MKRIGSLEALLNVISDRLGCTQNQIFGYTWNKLKNGFCFGVYSILKFNKYAINLAKKIMITLVQLAFYTHSFKTLAKKPKPNVLDT